MSTVATINSCPICQKRQETAALGKSGWFTFSEKNRVDHLTTKHSVEIRELLMGHYALAEWLVKKAVKVVIARICKYGDALDDSTVNKAMLTFLRHTLDGDKMKKQHAMTLGGTHLKNILPANKYQAYQDRLNANADMVRCALCIVPGCSLHNR